MENFRKTTVPEKGFTHGGKFHSDDVFSTALLRILNPKIQIERGFVVPEAFDGIVYDIGRGQFDHHQKEKEYRENGCPYAAFGLLWRAFGNQLADEKEVQRFDAEFVQPLDKSDNTGSDNMLAEIIAEFNPGWDSGLSYDECFWKAEEFAETILRNHFQMLEGMKRGKAVLDKAMDESDGKILVMPIYVPWKQDVIGSPYQFAVYPSNRGGFSIQGVPKSLEDNSLACDFPKEWWGVEAEELAKLSGIKSLRFCHPNGFLAAADTLEDAVKTAEYALRYNGKTC